MTKEIELGDKARDTITGYTGIVIAKTLWLHGCTRLSLQCDKLTKDGGIKKPETFDAPQLVLVKSKAKKEGAHRTGGDKPEIKMKNDPITRR